MMIKKIIFILSLCLLFDPIFGKEISLSFDDAPCGGSYQFSGMALKLIGEFKKVGILQ